MINRLVDRALSNTFCVCICTVGGGNYRLPPAAYFLAVADRALSNTLIVFVCTLLDLLTAGCHYQQCKFIRTQ